MSEQDTPPPKPKPGSLRDRIAAFETKPAATPTPPAPRSKPGNVQWKPKPVSPPSSPPQDDNSTKSTNERRIGGGMSAADAKATIGAGGSLKERMAALQGKAAFGAPSPPPPKPASDKPRWKPPVVPSPVADVSEEAVRVSSETEAKDIEEKEKSTIEETVDKPVEAIEEQTEQDPEDEERQRRANIAARMARLGGARIGMAPPVVAKKPQPRASHETEETNTSAEPSKTSSTDHEVSLPTRSGSTNSQVPGAGLVTSPQILSVGSTESEKKEYFDTPTTSSESTSVASSRSPMSMPVPAVPRRAGPPRKKMPKAPSPALTPSVPSEIDAQTDEVPVSTAVVEAMAPLDVSQDVEVTETPSSIFAVEHFETEEPVGAVEVNQEQINTHEAPAEVIDEVYEKFQHEHEDIPKVDDSDAVPAAVIANEEPEEEDEATRRKRIAERIAKSGAGMNPFSLPPQPIRRSSSMVPDAISPTDVRRSGSRQGSMNEPEVNTSRQSSTISTTDKSSIPLVDSKDGQIGVSSEVEEDKDNDDQALSRGDYSAMKESHKYETKPLEEIDDTPSSHEDFATDARGDHEIEESEVHGFNKLSITESAARGLEDVSLSNQIGDETGTRFALQDDNEDEEDEADQVYIQDRLPSDDHEAKDDIAPRVIRSLPPVPDLGKSNTVLPAAAMTPSETSSRKEFRRSIPPPPRPLPVHEEDGSSLPPLPKEFTSDVASRKDSRRSMPPPPRPLPNPIVSSAGAEEEERMEVECNHPVRPARRSMPPPPVPIEAAATEDNDEEEYPSVSSDEDDEHYANSPITYNRAEQEDIENSAAAQRLHEDETTVMTSSSPPPLVARRSIPPPRAPTTEPRTSDVEAYSKDFHGNTNELLSDSKNNDEPQHEILDEADGDPIDPVIYRPPSRLPTPSPPQTIQPSPVQERKPELTRATEAPEEESAKRQTIAERMAKLGGIKFGVPTPAPRPQRSPPPPSEEESSVDVANTTDEMEEPVVLDKTNEAEQEEEEERARKARIAAKLAGMGGLRLGMIPNIISPVSSQPSRVHTDDDTLVNKIPRSIPSPPQVPSHRPSVPSTQNIARAAPSTVLPAPPPQRPPPVSKDEAETESFDTADSEMVSIDTEESEMEEINYEDANEEFPPEVPSRAGRRQMSDVSSQEMPPPLPTGRPAPPQRPVVPVVPPVRRESRPSFAANEERASRSSASEKSSSQGHPHTDFVMVDDPILENEEIPPPPPPRPGRVTSSGSSRQMQSSSRPPTRSQTVSDTDSSNQGQWGLPEIPSASLDLTRNDDLSSSAWSEDSTMYPSTSGPPNLHHQHQQEPPQTAKPRPASNLTQQTGSVRPDMQLNADELLALWGRIGVHVSAVAHHMHDKSKKNLIGDGTYPGFIRAVLSQVKSAAPLDIVSQNYGHLIYAQSGNTVQWRATDIMPGDIIAFNDAKLKGHKGLQSYQQNVGIGEPLIGIICDYDPKKSKAKIYQANQHVGGSTVEAISYRFEDLKSGTLKVYRVAEA